MYFLQFLKQYKIMIYLILLLFCLIFNYYLLNCQTQNCILDLNINTQGASIYQNYLSYLDHYVCLLNTTLGFSETNFNKFIILFSVFTLLIIFFCYFTSSLLLSFILPLFSRYYYKLYYNIYYTDSSIISTNPYFSIVRKCDTPQPVIDNIAELSIATENCDTC